MSRLISAMAGLMVAIVAYVVTSSLVNTRLNEPVTPMTEETTVTSLPKTTETVVTISESLKEYPGMSAMMSIIPIVVAMGVLLMVNRMILGNPFTEAGRERIRERIRLMGSGGGRKNSRSDTLYFQTLAEDLKSLSMRDIADQIGVNYFQTSFLVNEDTVDYEPMTLVIKNKYLEVDTNFDWYVVDKHPEFLMYKVVGLHQSRRGLNCVYLVGKDAHTATPYIIRVPHEYQKSTIRQCVAWSMGIKETDEVVEV